MIALLSVVRRLNIDYNDGLYPTPVTSEWSTHVGVPGACCVSCVGVTESPEGKKRLLTHFALQLSEEATLHCATAWQRSFVTLLKEDVSRCCRHEEICEDPRYQRKDLRHLRVLPSYGGGNCRRSDLAVLVHRSGCHCDSQACRRQARADSGRARVEMITLQGCRLSCSCG